MKGMLYLEQSEIVSIAAQGCRQLGKNVLEGGLVLDFGASDAMDHGRTICAVATIGGASGSRSETLDQDALAEALEAGLLQHGFKMRKHPIRFYHDPEEGITAHASVQIPLPT